ncbi:MAG TPA: YfhO family protein, partial [Acidimicrobiales bacterium]|nr:YfhO family protein [Acidimicrobiales bacterium]
PLNGVYLPLRTGGRCEDAWVRLSLVSNGRTLATSTRSAFDVGGGWTGFAIIGREQAAGDPYQLRAESTRPACRLAVGLAGGQMARQLLIEDPGQSIRLASTEQAWIYERPSAWELVSAHRRWRAFPDQAQLLAWAATRPPEDANVAAYVGRDRPGAAGEPGPEPVVVSSAVVDNRVRAVVQGDVQSLVAVSQDLAPGWTATVDGEPADLVAVDGALQGVFVPPGRHTLELSYMPRAFVLGSAVSAPAFLAAVLVWAQPWKRRRGTPDRSNR